MADKVHIVKILLVIIVRCVAEARPLMIQASKVDNQFANTSTVLELN